VPTEKIYENQLREKCTGILLHTLPIFGILKTKFIYDISVCTVLFILKKELFVLH
jgi:hypothetical protein